MPDLESSRPTPNSGNSPGPHHGYDPNQPRVPSGHGDGGQWTKTGGGTSTIARREAVVDHSKQESWGSYVDGYRADGSLAEQRVFNRDGSRIVSEFKAPDDPGDWDERHTVVLPEGQKFTFENSGNVQRIFDGEGNLVSATEWTEEGLRPLPVGQLAFLPAAAPAWRCSARQRDRRSTPLLSRFSRGFRAGRIPTDTRSSPLTLKNMKSLKQRGMRSAQLFSWDL